MPPKKANNAAPRGRKADAEQLTVAKQAKNKSLLADNTRTRSQSTSSQSDSQDDHSPIANNTRRKTAGHEKEDSEIIGTSDNTDREGDADKTSKPDSKQEPKAKGIHFSARIAQMRINKAKKLAEEKEEKEEKERLKKAEQKGGKKKLPVPKELPISRPSNSYRLFCASKEGREAVLKENPNLTYHTVTKILGGIWREMKEKGKDEKYKIQAEKEKAEYNKLIAKANKKPSKK